MSSYLIFLTCVLFHLSSGIFVQVVNVKGNGSKNKGNGSKNKGRRLETFNGLRRLENGETFDPVCVRTMELVRALPELGDIIFNPSKGNAELVAKAAGELVEACQEEGTDENQMAQCAFYVQQAMGIDVEVLESAWIFAFGDNTELHRGCGKVVTAVNEHMRRRAEVEIEVVDGVESFVHKSSPLARRLVGAASAVAAGTGLVLGHICRNFNPTTFEVMSLEA